MTINYLYLVNAWDSFCAVLALDNGLLVRLVPVLKLAVELELNHLQVPVVVIPREVAVDTDDIHVRGLGQEWSCESTPHTEGLCFKVRRECR